MGLIRDAARALGLIEERQITPGDVPWHDSAPAAPQRVTQQRALTLTPVFAANRHIADHISTLPVKAYRRLGERREPMSLPPLFRFLEQDKVLLRWVYTALTSMTLRGNAVGLITQRDGLGFPTGVTWLPLEDIYVDDQNYPQSTWYWRGRVIGRDELVHIPWFTVAGRTLGLSPIEAFAATVNQGLGAQEYSTGWFDAGGIPPGTFRNSEKAVDSTDAEVIKARLVSAIRSRKPIVYGSDWEYTPITIPPEQAQFVETAKLTANQIAAIYGIAPEEIGGEAANSLTYSNEEHRQTNRMANLRPYVVRLEQGLSAHLPELQYVRFNADATIRADLKTRHEVYRIARDIGLRSLDEIRAMEDAPPLPDGQGADYTPLSRQVAQPQTRGFRRFPALPAPPPPSNGHKEEHHVGA